MMHRTSVRAMLIAGLSIAAGDLASAQQNPPAPATPASTARPHDQAPTATAARRSGAVEIDGRMNEAAWQVATPVTELRQFDPREGQPVSERTEERIQLDDVASTVGLSLYDSG